MATVDRSDNGKTAETATESRPAFLRNPFDRVDFGYEIARTTFNGMSRRPGPEGLSLTARVYE